MNHRAALLLAAFGVSVSASVFAHHSFTAFDMTKTVALDGTVKEWQWTNPHTWLYVVVTDASGKAQEWGIEGQSPQVMRGEQHYARTSFKAGDRVKVNIHPRRDGSMGGSFVSATTADGKPLTTASEAAEPK